MGLQIYEDGFKPANLNGHTCRSSRYLSSVVSVLSLCKNFVKVVDLFLVAQLQIANLKVNILIGMHTYKEESHHSDFWSTYNHKTKGIKGNPKNNIQLLAHDTDGGKEQRNLRGTKTWRVQLQGWTWPRFPKLSLDAPTGLLVVSNPKKQNIAESWTVGPCYEGQKNSLNNTFTTDWGYLEVDTTLALVLWWKQSVIAIMLTGIFEVCRTNRLQDQIDMQLSCKLALGRMSQHSIWKPLRNSTFPSETWWEHNIKLKSFIASAIASRIISTSQLFLFIY